MNPYAPPVDSGPVPQGVGGGMPEPWTLGEVLSHGLERLKTDWPVLIFAPMVGQFIANIPSWVLQALAFPTVAIVEPQSGVYWFLYACVMLFAIVVGAFFNVGLTRIILDSARGNSPSFATLFTGGDRFLPMLGTTILMLLGIYLGMLLCIVPGVILALGFAFSQMYVVDAKLGPIEAMSESWRVTTGQKMNLFVMVLAFLGIVLVGFMACFIGVFPASAICMVAFGTVFLRVSGRGAPAAEQPAPAFVPPQAPPAGFSGG